MSDVRREGATAPVGSWNVLVGVPLTVGVDVPLGVWVTVSLGVTGGPATIHSEMPRSKRFFLNLKKTSF